MNRYGTADIIYSGNGALPEAFGRWCKWEDANAEIERLRDALEQLDAMFDPTSQIGELIGKALGGDK